MRLRERSRRRLSRRRTRGFAAGHEVEDWLEAEARSKINGRDTTTACASLAKAIHARVAKRCDRQVRVSWAAVWSPNRQLPAVPHEQRGRGNRRLQDLYFSKKLLTCLSASSRVIA
jgi:hypothetical protein